MSPLVLRPLLYMYTNQSLQVRWGNHTSAKFSVKNGVKQGGVLSHILFSIYMNGLFDRLRVSGIGCRIGNQYTGGLGYADDLTLIVSSKTACNLSYIFAKIMLMSMMYYLMGQKVNFPDAWKIANVIPIFKRGSIGSKIETKIDTKWNKLMQNP